MKRRLAVLAACLLLGAALTMLVAWACAAWSSPWSASRLESPRDERSRKVAESLGVLRPGATTSPEEAAAGFGARWISFDLFGEGVSRRSLWRFTHVLAGWPALAFEGVVVRQRFPSGGSNVREAVHDGIMLSRKPSPVPAAAPGARDVRILPFRPVWRGLVIDLLFHMSIAWCLLAGPFKLRLLVRRLRAQCTGCAYPIGSSTECTECGRPLEISRWLSLLQQALSAAVATPARRSATTWGIAALAALMLGAIINVVVACGCAIAGDAMPWGPLIEYVEPDLAWWRRHAPADAPAPAPARASRARLGPGKSWISMAQPQGWYAVRIRAGWPMPALERDRWDAETRDHRQTAWVYPVRRPFTIWSAALPAPGFLPDGNDGLLPLRPVLPGFVLNTVLFALPLMLLGRGAAAVRSRRRRRI